jgi:Lon protease-like protein
MPLFPLPGVVHFPKTKLHLHIFEPRYRQLVSDLEALPLGERLIGIATLESSGSGRPAIYRAGTAGEMIDVEELDDGRSNIVIHGAFRFEIEEEIGAETPYRQARVVPLEERDCPSAAKEPLTHDLIELCRELIPDLENRFPLSAAEVEELSERAHLEELVNGIAAQIELPTHQRITLLCESIEQRAISVLSILRNQRNHLKLLRPFRKFSATPDLN